MKSLALWTALLAALPGTAFAGDKPVIAPVPGWVKPIAPPPVPEKDDGAPIRVLLNDSQVSLQPGKTAVYRELDMKIETPQGLAIGNVSLPWRPDTDELVVHKLRIRRGDKLIDVLDGRTFTVLRREANLELAMLDGVLTANVQAEGLQVGDVLELATTVTSSDPVLKGHVEGIEASWNGLPIDRAHVRVFWPAGLKTRYQESAGLPPATPVTSNGVTTIEFSQDNVQPIIPPKEAPLRFRRGRMLEFTDYASWSDLGALMAPLYVKAATLAANSPILAEIERIKSASADPKARAEAALALAQDRIRYVALAMAAGGLVPVDADTTWTRRYGDCKAKTALLLALLHGLGIQAQPVVVNAESGDGFDRQLPMIGLFDHVLVRATIAGKTYWLDGTRTGDTSLDRLHVPAFDWGLPLLPRDAALVRIQPLPLDAPTEEVVTRIDASNGISLPAPFKSEIVLRGDSALATNLALSGLNGDAHDRAMRDFWRNRFDFVEIKSMSDHYDPAAGQERLTMEGLATMDWKNGWYETDGTRIGYHADFNRDPGPDRDAPFAVTYPSFDKTTETIVLPPDFPQQLGRMNAEVDETVAGIEYHRHATMAGSTVTIERSSRSLVPEFPAQDAPAAAKRLRELGDKGVYLYVPAGYVQTTAEQHKLESEAPKTSDDYTVRGYFDLTAGRVDDAINAFTQALALDPKSAAALADRGLARVQRKQYDLATADLDAAAAIQPGNVVVFRGRALMAEQQGRLRDALANCVRSLEIQPRVLAGWQQRVRIEIELGDRKAALADAAAALAIDPDWSSMHWYRAQTLILDGKRDEARAEAAAAAANSQDAEAQHIAGSIYLMLSDHADAVSAFSRALQLKPTVRAYLARSLAYASDDVAARADVDAALKLDPQSADAWFYKAKNEAADDHLDAAIEDSGKAIAFAPNRTDILVQRAGLYSAKGDRAAAGKDIDAALAIDPRNAAAIALRASQAQEAGDPKLAVTLLSTALNKGDNPTLLGQRAEAEHLAGDDAAALADSEAALRVMPQWPQMRFMRASIFRTQDKPVDAVAEASAMIRDNPNDAYTQVVAGRIYAQLHKDSEAMAAMSAALKIKPEAYIYLNRGLIRPKTDVPGRLADFDAALKLDPTNVDAAVAKAHEFERHGNLTAAIAVYDAIVPNKPNLAILRLNRSVLFVKKGDKQRAEEDLTAAHASPEFSEPGVLNSSCWNMATANVELTRALADCDAALKQLPGNATFLDSRAFVLLRMGRIDDAIEGYTRALERSPRLPASLYGRAVAWARKGDKAKSDADLAAALKFGSDVREQFADYGVTL